MATLHITIDGTTYSLVDDDQEAAALLRLAGRDPQVYDLFLVDKHGVETHIKDKQIVDLRNNTEFRSRRRVHFTIDGEQHTSWDDDQTAAALLRLAGFDPTTYNLARIEGSGAREDFADEQLITIHEGDQFVTEHAVYKIIVNTKPHPWNEEEISFEQVVELASPGQPYDPAGTTVEYSRGHGPDKSLRQGERVRVKDGMIFDVEPTIRS